MESNRFEQYARIAAVALLVLGCFLVLAPFLGAILFAGVLCLSTWPAYAWLRDRWGGRSSLAALVLVLAMAVALVLPVALAAQSLVVHSAGIVESLRTYIAGDGTLGLPDFVKAIPMAGPALDEYWTRLMGSRDELVALGKRMADPAKNLLVAMGTGMGNGLLQIVLALFVAFFFYRDGDRVKAMLFQGMVRLAGPEHGLLLVTTAQGAVKGVVYGMIGTALAQAAVALVGFLIAGVPGAVLLSALTFVLSLVPMGPVFIWGGAAAWLYSKGDTGWAIFMVAYGAGVISSVDNFLKPILMSRAGNLSMLVVVLGVFGGAIAFGFIGLFVGPALLAVAWSLAKTWLEVEAKEGITP